MIQKWTRLLTFPPIINEWHAARSDPYYAPWGGLDQCVEAYRQRTCEVAQRLACIIHERGFGCEFAVFFAPA